MTALPYPLAGTAKLQNRTQCSGEQGSLIIEKVSRVGMGKIKRALIIWLLKQLEIEESHIEVVVGELTMQEARQKKAQEEFSSYVAILDKVYGKQDPFIVGDTRPRGRAHIYFIANRKQKAVKIGYSTNPASRLSELQISAPNKLELLATIEGDMRTEHQLHQRFAAYRLNGEWFQMADELMAFIDSLAKASDRE